MYGQTYPNDKKLRFKNNNRNLNSTCAFNFKHKVMFLWEIFVSVILYLVRNLIRYRIFFNNSKIIF